MNWAVTRRVWSTGVAFPGAIRCRWQVPTGWNPPRGGHRSDLDRRRSLNLNPHKNRPLDELLQESCNEEVLDRILEILEKKQRTELEHQRGTGNGPPR